MRDVDKSDRQYVRSCHLRKLQEKGATRAVAPASDKEKGVLDLRRMLNGVLQRCVGQPRRPDRFSKHLNPVCKKGS